MTVRILEDDDEHENEDDDFSTSKFSLKTEMALDSVRVRSGSVSFSIRVESLSGIDSSR